MAETSAVETETGLVDTERGEGGRRPLGGLGDPSAGKNRKSVQGLEGGFGELREEEGLRRTRRRGWGWRIKGQSRHGEGLAVS